MSELTYKKITDVERIEALNDGATVFVNDNGAMKQVGAGAIGGGSGGVKYFIVKGVWDDDLNDYIYTFNMTCDELLKALQQDACLGVVIADPSQYPIVEFSSHGTWVKITTNMCAFKYSEDGTFVPMVE